MRIRYLVPSGLLALALALGTLTPAFGGPGSTPAKEARAAKKLANKALQKANKALKAAKAPGPAGQTGPAGSARAYALVLFNGVVETANSKGVAAGSVSKPQSGLYCFKLDFVPSNVVATISDGKGGQISTFLHAAVGPACGSFDSAEVLTANSTGTAEDQAFSVLFN